MQLLNRYLLKQFGLTFFTVSTAFVAIYLFVDFFEKFEDFKKAGSTDVTFTFFILNIPFILDQLSPVLILLTGIITFGILNHNNELRALKAAGIPQMSIIKPIVIGALLTTLLFLCIAQWILPKTISVTNSIWHEKIRGKVPLGIHRGGRYYYKGKEGFYSFEWPDTKTYTFKNFSYSKWNANYQMSYMLSAKLATWTEKGWILKDGQTQKRGQNGTYSYSLFTNLNTDLPETPDLFFIPEYRSAELSIVGLFIETQQKDTQEGKTLAWANFLGRLSYIFLGIPLLLLGLPILMVSYQRWGRDLTIAIPASCLLAFFAWGCWGTLQSLAKAGYFHPLLAATIVHLAFTGAGLFLLVRQDR